MIIQSSCSPTSERVIQHEFQFLLSCSFSSRWDSCSGWRRQRAGYSAASEELHVSGRRRRVALPWRLNRTTY